MADGDYKWAYTVGDLTTGYPSACIDENAIIYIPAEWPYGIHAIYPAGNQKWWRGFGQIKQATPFAHDNVIYLGTADDRLYAWNDDNTQKWAPYVTGGDIVEASPVVSKDGSIVYQGSRDSKLHAVYTATGTAKWTRILGGYQDSCPAIDQNGIIYVTARDGKLYALDPDDGSDIWTPYSSGALSVSSPALSDDGSVIYFGSLDHYLHAVNAVDGSQKWVYDTTGEIFQASPAVGGDGTIYMGGEAYKLHAINPSDGSQKWVKPLGHKMTGGPVVRNDGLIIFGCWDYKLYALNPEDGSEAWTYPAPSTIPSTPFMATDGTIYFNCYNKKLYAIEGVSRARLNPSDFYSGAYPLYFTMSRNEPYTAPAPPVVCKPRGTALGRVGLPVIRPAVEGIRQSVTRIKNNLC